MQVRLQGRGGERIWVQLTVNLVMDQAGEPDHFIAIIADMSVEKRNEEARWLLMREVDHRARNALAVVQSVVRLTEADDPRVFREAVIGRVDALARAQASLSKSQWEGALIGDIVQAELSTLADPPSFDFSGPDLWLRPEDVQPLSMILHELATNARKHGALARPDGRVDVKWARDGADGWNLDWREHGDGGVQAPSRKGFGSRLIGRLAGQLQGTTEFHWRADGLLFELRSRAPIAPGLPPERPALREMIPSLELRPLH